MEGGWYAEDGRQWKVDDRRWMVDRERKAVDGRRWTEGDGWQMVNGRHCMVGVGGQRGMTEGGWYKVYSQFPMTFDSLPAIELGRIICLQVW